MANTARCLACPLQCMNGGGMLLYFLTVEFFDFPLFLNALVKKQCKGLSRRQVMVDGSDRCCHGIRTGSHSRSSRCPDANNITFRYLKSGRKRVADKLDHTWPECRMVLLVLRFFLYLSAFIPKSLAPIGQAVLEHDLAISFTPMYRALIWVLVKQGHYSRGGGGPAIVIELAV